MDFFVGRWRETVAEEGGVGRVLFVFVFYRPLNVLSCIIAGGHDYRARFRSKGEWWRVAVGVYRVFIVARLVY